MRTKILGLIGLAMALALIGSMSLKSQQADAFGTVVDLTGGTGGVFQWSVTVDADETDGPILLTSSLDQFGGATFPLSISGVFDAACTAVVTGTAGPAGTCTGVLGGTPQAPTWTLSAASLILLDTDAVADTVTITGVLRITGAPVGTPIYVIMNTPVPAGGGLPLFDFAIVGPGSGAAGPTMGPGTNCPFVDTTLELRVCKVNQNGVGLSATFALQGPSGVIQLVTSSSAVPTPLQDGAPVGDDASIVNAGVGTCATSQTCARLLSNNLGIGSPGLIGPLTMAPGTYSLREITGPANSIQIQIINGLGQQMPPGDFLTVALPCPSVAECTFKFTNSQALAGAASATGSSVVAVIGGSSFGITNRTNIEIAPAPGSDDDARLDIRIRDSNNVLITGAHVIVLTDKGRIAMRQDIAQTPSITGYDVIEPASPDFGSIYSGDPCDVGIGLSTSTITGATFANPFRFGGGSEQAQDGFTNDSGIVSACLFVSDDLVPGITPGRANITVIVENSGNFGPGTFGLYGSANLVLTVSVNVIGPPASIRVAASPTTVQCGEKATITATITDSIGQNVSDHTRVELVSNFGATIGGTGSTLGFPGVGAVNPLSSSAAETFSGVATAFLLTSTEHVGPYEVVIASGGSTGGVYQPGGSFLGNTFTAGIAANAFAAAIAAQGQTVAQGNIAGLSFPILSNPQVFGGSGVFSTAPVSAQATVTCSLPVVAVPVVVPAAAAPIRAPITGEGIRPPNTGDAGLAAGSDSSSALFIVGGLVFALAGVATLKVARR